MDNLGTEMDGCQGNTIKCLKHKKGVDLVRRLWTYNVYNCKSAWLVPFVWLESIKKN